MVVESVAIHIAKKALGKLEDKFVGKVIHRWQNHRARVFLEAFAQTVAEDNAGPDAEQKVDDALDKALSDERKSEILFDAYRHVVLSASKELGPRIIALLTAKLLAAGRYATPGEELIFRAAETFTDSELIGLRGYLPDPQKIHSNVTPSGGITQRLHREKSETGDRLRGTIGTGPINLVDYLGPWANKALQLGLVSQEIKEETSRRDRYGQGKDIEDVKEIEWSVTFVPETRLLVELISRAERSIPRPAQS